MTRTAARKIRTKLAVFSILAILTITICLPYIIPEATHDQYDKIILENSRRHNLSPELIKSVIRKESNFHYQARGLANEFGLMQFRLGTVKDWQNFHKKSTFPGTTVLLNPEINIEIGSWYLAKAVRDWQNHKDWKVLALAQYNAGRTHARKWAPQDPKDNAFENITFPMTKAYISDILKYEQYYRKHFQKGHH